MTGVEFANNIRTHLKVTSTTLPDAEIVTYANEFLPTLSRKINKLNNKILGIPATRDLIASDDTFANREYSFPQEDLRFLVSVEAKVGDEGTKWVKFKQSELEFQDIPTDETTIQSMFSNSFPNARHLVFRGSLWLLCGDILAVTGGLKIWYLGRIENITTATLALETELSASPGSGATSWKHGIPDDFHELLARYVRMKYKTANDSNISLDEADREFKFDLEQALNDIKITEMDKEIDISPHSMYYDSNYGKDL